MAKWLLLLIPGGIPLLIGIGVYNYVKGQKEVLDASDDEATCETSASREDD